MSRRSRPARRAPWITFEGIEGSGKSTQIERLVRRLEAAGRAVLATREPGGTELGRRLRAVLLSPGGPTLDPLTELLLYAADRAQHLTEVVLPALERGTVVVCDRYLDATLAYQGYGRGLGTAAVLELHRRPPLDSRPDRTILLDVALGPALERARRRNRSRGIEATEGRYEAEPLDFHRRVRDGYRELAAGEPDRFRVVDASGQAAEVERRVTAALADLLSALGVG